MLRLWLIAMLAASLLAIVRGHDLLHRTGLLGSCAAMHTPVGRHGAWRSCQKGVLDGRPDLSRSSCRREGRAGAVEYWRCPARVQASPIR
ncbi:MAG: hypothetical protein WBB76_10740 [Gaiellaceae bacterium]